MFSQLALMGRELDGPPLAGIQENVVFGPLKDFRGSYYYFRVLASRKAGPPSGLDEVRDAAIRAVRTEQGLEKLKAETEQYRERAVADGMDALATSLGGTVRAGVEVTGQMVRATAGGQQPDPALDSPEVRDAIMGIATKLDPKADAATLDAAGRTVAIHSAKARGLVIAQVTRFRPMTSEVFHLSAAAINGFASRELDAASVIQSFSFDRLRERHAYKVVDAPDEEDAASETAETEAAPAGG